MAIIDISCPKERNIAININPVKCLLENKLQIPQKESKVHSQPLVKKQENERLMQLSILTINIERKGG